MENLDQLLNDRKNLIEKKMIENILTDLRWNLTFTNLISEMYKNILFFLNILDTYQVRIYENIRKKYINFLRNYLNKFDDTKFNNTVSKDFNIFENTENYFLNRRKNRQFLYGVFIKIILTRKVFEKLLLKIRKTRYAPLGPGYFEAKSSFESAIKSYF